MKMFWFFSNLFGVLKAGDVGLPDYKLKQSETFNNLKTGEVLYG